MQPTANTYMLKVGEQGKERLAMLNELFADTSRHLLIKAGLHEVKQHYIQYHIATAEEIAARLQDMNQFINDDNYLVSFARTTQMIGPKQK